MLRDEGALANRIRALLVKLAIGRDEREQCLEIACSRALDDKIHLRGVGIAVPRNLLEVVEPLEPQFPRVPTCLSGYRVAFVKP
jgi:hypothetical protein